MALLVLPGASFLYAINILRGLAGAFLSGSYEAMLYESVHVEKTPVLFYSQTYASVLALATLGFVTAALVCTTMTAQYGAASYQGLIFVTALLQFLSFVIAMTLKDGSNNHEVGAVTAVTKPFALLREGLAVVYSNHTVFYLALAALLTVNGEYFLREMYQPLFEGAWIPLASLGVVLAVGSVLNLTFMRYSYILERYFKLPTLLFVLYVATAFGYLVLSISGDRIVLVGTTILLFGVFNIDRPLRSDYVNEHLSNSVRATALSAVSLASSLGTITVRVILSAILNGMGLRAGFMVQGALLLLGAVITLWSMVRCGCIRRRINMVSSSRSFSS